MNRRAQNIVEYILLMAAVISLIVVGTRSFLKSSTEQTLNTAMKGVKHVAACGSCYDGKGDPCPPRCGDGCCEPPAETKDNCVDCECIEDPLTCNAPLGNCNQPGIGKMKCGTPCSHPQTSCGNDTCMADGSCCAMPACQPGQCGTIPNPCNGGTINCGNCPVPGGWCFSAPSACSSPCGPGTRTKSTTGCGCPPPQNGGNCGADPGTVTEACNNGLCCVPDCAGKYCGNGGCSDQPTVCGTCNATSETCNNSSGICECAGGYGRKDANSPCVPDCSTLGGDYCVWEQNPGPSCPRRYQTLAGPGGSNCDYCCKAATNDCGGICGDLNFACKCFQGAQGYSSCPSTMREMGASSDCDFCCVYPTCGELGGTCSDFACPFGTDLGQARNCVACCSN